MLVKEVWFSLFGRSQLVHRYISHPLSATASGEMSVAQVTRSLAMRLDNLKSQYHHELLPLTHQRQVLVREVSELKVAREHFLEETTVLNARNEQLAQLSAQYARRMEATTRSETPVQDTSPPGKKSTSFDKPPSIQASVSTSSTHSTTTLVEERERERERDRDRERDRERDRDREVKVGRTSKPEHSDATKHGKFIKWPGSHRGREPSTGPSESKGKMHMEHNFQQASALRFARCDHCTEKLWGASQYRCTSE